VNPATDLCAKFTSSILGRMTELLLIRHGETDYNRQLRFQGQIDVPLNATEPLDALLSSDLQRARATAEPLRSHRGLAMEVDAAWREQAFGVLEGVEVPTVRLSHPELWAAWSRHEADRAPPGGESNVVFHARVMHALRMLLAAWPAGARLAVFTHGGVLDMVWRDVNGRPLAGPRECAIPNTGLNRLRWDGSRLHIVQWADAAHLEA
jgi:2,3-bisphosphoglycerate-dependent phosphoglycerate mutase